MGRQPSVPTAARVSWGPCRSRCSCRAWQEPGSGPALWNAAGHCPSPRGMSTCPVPGAAGVLVATAPQRRRLAPCRLSWATGWGPGVSGQLPCRGGAPGGGESEAPPGPGVILLRITPWAHIPGTFEPSSSPPQGPAFSDSQGQWGRGCPERTDLALSAPSMVVLSWDPSPGLCPPPRPPCPDWGSANGGPSWRCPRSLVLDLPL